MNLERDLEIYQREAREHERLGRQFWDLAKKTRQKIIARNEAEAEKEAAEQEPK